MHRTVRRIRPAKFCIRCVSHIGPLKHKHNIALQKTLPRRLTGRLTLSLFNRVLLIIQGLLYRANITRVCCQYGNLKSNAYPKFNFRLCVWARKGGEDNGNWKTQWVSSIHSSIQSLLFLLLTSSPTFPSLYSLVFSPNGLVHCSQVLPNPSQTIVNSLFWGLGTWVSYLSRSDRFCPR